MRSLTQLHAQITFGELAAVAEAVQATVVMTDEDVRVRFVRCIGSSEGCDHLTKYDVTWQATEVALDVRRAELGMETDGALADISAQHEQEVQNHGMSAPGASPAHAFRSSRSHTLPRSQSCWTCSTSVQLLRMLQRRQ